MTMPTNRLTVNADGWPSVLPVLEAKDFDGEGMISEWWWRCFKDLNSHATAVFWGHMDLPCDDIMTCRQMAKAWNAAVAACGYNEDCETEDLWG